MADLTSKVLELASPLTQELAELIGDLSASEIQWIDNRLKQERASIIDQCVSALVKPTATGG